jgi:prepilin-type processing-associated H-X9-DG protein
MEHAFPPPFRWGSAESVQLAVIVALQIIATGLPLLARLRKKPDHWCCIFWGALCLANLWFALSYPEKFSSNWRHRAVATPFVITVGLTAAVVAFYSCFREVIRLWQAARLMELVRALAGISVPVALYVLLLPGYGCGFRRGSPRSECKNNLKQIGLALHNYHEVLGIFPASRISDPFVSWRVHLLQFLDGESLYWDYDQEQAWDSDTNTAIAQQQVWGVYDCPSRPMRVDAQGRYFTDYAMLTGRGAFSLPNNPIRKQDVTDGLSNTLAVTEASGLNIVWTEPRDAETDSQPIGVNLAGDEDSESRGIASSRHSNGAHVLFADGTVEFLNEDIDPQVLKALTTIAGGEPSGDF